MKGKEKASGGAKMKEKGNRWGITPKAMGGGDAHRDFYVHLFGRLSSCIFSKKVCACCAHAKVELVAISKKVCEHSGRKRSSKKRTQPNARRTGGSTRDAESKRTDCVLVVEWAKKGRVARGEGKAGPARAKNGRPATETDADKCVPSFF